MLVLIQLDAIRETEMNDAGTHTLVAGSRDLLLGALPVERNGIGSRRILKAPGVGLTRLTLDAGQTLREHVATAPILIQALAGDAVVEVGGERIELSAGAIIHIDAHVRHAVEALTEAHLLLTVLHGQEPRELSRETPTATEQRPRKYRARAASPRTRRVTSSLVLASSGADSAAIDAVVRRHAEIAGGLATHSARLLDAAASIDSEAFARIHSDLLGWCRDQLGPLLEAEAGVLYPAVREIQEGGPLAELLEAETTRIRSIVDYLEARNDPTDIAAATVSLRVRVGHHLSTQIERMLPALAASPNHQLAALWAQVERETASPDEAPLTDASLTDTSLVAAGPASQLCECGIVDGPELPELDVRTIPHAIRHASVFGALDAVGLGGGLILVAPHDPLPLLAQIEERSPGGFEISYLEEGPDDWRLQFLRIPA
jgi:uncharacterized protein (DUF2249 family)/quercetin dioxygenase-like cupin family protein